MTTDARQGAFTALKQIYYHQAYTDLALNQMFARFDLTDRDRSLASELVYGCVRRQRTLDQLVDQLGTKAVDQQPPDLRLVLHLGLYQLRYLDQIPPSAAVNTSVNLAKQQGLKGLSKVVNGLLRQYLRLAPQGEVLQLPSDRLEALGIAESFSQWLITLWAQQWGEEMTMALARWFNQVPTVDLRVNPLRATVSQVYGALRAENITCDRLEGSPQGIRLGGKRGAIPQLPGYGEGWWTVQDASAQLVAHLLDPQPGETVFDVCAAPGGKTTHMAELMENQGRIIAGDLHQSRLKKVRHNAQRLGIDLIEPIPGDARQLDFPGQGDRLLLDVPCSGLGTLHKRPDLRWRQTPHTIEKLCQLQQELLRHTCRWVKPGGTLVYATCTLNHQENQDQIHRFLRDHPQWAIEAPPEGSFLRRFMAPEQWIYLIPPIHHSDGFFMVKLRHHP